MADSVMVVVPWHNEVQLEAFMAAWNVRETDERICFTQDTTRAGCGATKNRGVQRAMALGADIVIVLDDDCYPSHPGQSLDQFMLEHAANLCTTAKVTMFEAVTCPESRGTPYHCRTIDMPVAASMGFWNGVGDYDAPSQLVRGPTEPMRFHKEAIHGRYFPLCGMNLAFRPREWLPWCEFIDVPRFDDIWMGWLWQKEAYRLGYCFRLDGPLVNHSRQSNVWQNLRDEAVYLERNETLWRDIAQGPCSYGELRKLLPV